MQGTQETRVWSLGREDPVEKRMAIHLVFLPGKLHRQRSLAGYSPWGHKELDTTEQTEHTCKINTYHLNMKWPLYLYLIHYLSKVKKKQKTKNKTKAKQKTSPANWRSVYNQRLNAVSYNKQFGSLRSFLSNKTKVGKRKTCPETRVNFVKTKFPHFLMHKN